MNNKIFLKDGAERVVSTYLQAFFGLLIAGTFTLNIGALHAAAVAALPAALSAAKAILATRTGDPASASLLDPVSPAEPLVAPAVERDTKRKPSRK